MGNASTAVRLRDFAAGLVVESPGKTRSGDAPWWSTWRCWLVLAALSTVPFIVAPYPPLGDLFSHIGRYHVMLFGDQSEYLQRYYHFQWGVSANLGQDLMMIPVGHLLGAERGAFFLTALIPPAMILALRQISVGAHGAVQPTALLALPFAYSLPFLFGFANYWLGVAAALWVIALWFRIRTMNVVPRSLLLVLLSLLTWLCHLAGWGVLVIGVGCIELAAAWRSAGGRSLSGLFFGGLRAAPVLVPILASLIFRSGASGVVGAGSYFHLKFYWLAFTLRDQSMILDLASQAALALAVPFLLFRGWARVEPALLFAATVLFALFWIVPTNFMGGFYADLRLLPVVAILAFLSFRMAPNPRREAIVAALAIGLFVVRIGATAVGWAQASADVGGDLRALDGIERGSRIAVLAPIRMCDNWPNDSVSHIPSLAIARREAFVNTEWDIPGQQMMQPVYNRDHGYNSMISSNLKPVGAQCGGVEIGPWLRDLPRDRFDYVWLFRAGPLPAEAASWLSLRYQGPKGALYAIEGGSGNERGLKPSGFDPM